jgi:uncharacterized protein (DUF305 family)
MKTDRRLALGLALAGLVAASSFGLAQTAGHAGHGAAATDDSPATTAFKAANMKMHKEMDIAYSGNADADFVRGMIPHHQGAIDMAKVQLAHGKDPELRKLAQSIIADQEKEIATMRDWLRKNGK